MKGYCCLLLLVLVPHLCLAVGWEAGDYIVGRGNEPGAAPIAVYDASWTYKGDLDATVIGDVRAFSWLPDGRLAAEVRAPTFDREMRIYTPDGTLDAVFPLTGGLGWGLVHEGDLFYRSADTLSGQEVDFAGNVLRTFGPGNSYNSVEHVAGVLYFGTFFDDVDFYDMATGNLLGSIDLPDGGQEGTASIIHRPATDTLLMTALNDNTLFERTLAGVFVGAFEPVPGSFSLQGIALGDNDEVLATDCDGFGGIARWSSAGVLIGTVDLAGVCHSSVIWAPTAIFSDGFESGDTAAWSATVP